MRIGLLAQSPSGRYGYAGQNNHAMGSVGPGGNRRKQAMDIVLAQLSGNTRDTIKNLDLSKIKPQQLRDAASDLFHDRQITREVASMLFSLGSDLSDDAEIDALAKLHAAQERERRLPADRFRTENLRLYQESLELVEGLRSVISFLRSGHSVDVFA